MPGTVIDQTKQCVQPMDKMYSRDPTTAAEAQKIAATAADCSPEGYCTCTQGFCAGADMWCHEGSYTLKEDVYTITTTHGEKKREPTRYDPGNEEPIYMAGSTPTGDGLLKVGKADDPAAAKWRVSVLEDKHFVLFTEAYSTMVLQEHAECKTALNPVIGKNATTCELLVAGVENPFVRDSFWQFVSVSPRHGSDRGVYIYYEKTESVVAVSSDGSISICPFSSVETEECAGEAVFYFDPKLPEEILTAPPRRYAMTLIIHAGTLALVIVLTVMVFYAYSRQTHVAK